MVQSPIVAEAQGPATTATMTGHFLITPFPGIDNGVFPPLKHPPLVKSCVVPYTVAPIMEAIDEFT